MLRLVTIFYISAFLLSVSHGGKKTKDNIQGYSNFNRERSDIKKDFPRKRKLNRTDRQETQGCCDNCVFPFKIYGREYEMCTNIFTEDEYMCASEVDSDGYLTAWDYCDTCCPGASVETTPQLQANPANEPGNCYCGISNPDDWYGKIVGGYKSFVGMMPWQVAIMFNYPYLDYQGCGGSLVSDRYVVTAAHCTEGASASNLFVRVGDTILATEFEAVAFTYGVLQIIDHPDYDSYTLSNDISILKLDGSVDLYSYPNIKPACLPSLPYSGGAVTSGWGTLYSGGPQVSHLRDVDVNVFPNGECGEMNPEMDLSMICAGYFAGGKDACQGDSGGPLVAHNPHNPSYTLTGVVSWGYGCAAPDLLGIYANVSHFTNWLYDEMPDLSTCPPLDSELPPPPVTYEFPPFTTSPTPDPGKPCFDKNNVSFLKTFDKIKKVPDPETCSALCLESKINGDGCEYFNFKDHKNKSKRLCFLLRVEGKTKKSYYSGPAGCVFN